MKKNTVFKATWALTLASVLLTGCNQDSIIDPGGSPDGTGADSFTITKTDEGFDIHWKKGYDGYSEIIYKKNDTTNPRGNGYPFTNNATGDYTLHCKLGYSDDANNVSYRCSRPDISTTSRVLLEKHVEYQWLVSYGTDHEHGEVGATMEYTNSGLVIE